MKDNKGSLIFTNHIEEAISDVIDGIRPKGIFILCDTNTGSLVVPRLRSMCPALSDAPVITVSAGDTAKNIRSASEIWERLIDGGATRHSLLINAGGGMITDLGGFVAAAYKRGMHCVNVPTTLLAAVDASVGGKTAVNFNGLKNIIGVFSNPDASIISTTFFTTLPDHEILSGYAEMIKHALLSGPKDFADIIGYDITEGRNDPEGLLDLLRRSVSVKAEIVTKDPHEHGLRKALNLGHTVAHAFESLAFSRKAPVSHGYAVAWGLVVEGVLSHTLCGLDSTVLHTLAAYVREHYGAFHITCDDYPSLIASMRQDKKNISSDHINFTLLRSPGEPVLDVTATPDRIETALDIYRDLFSV